MFQSSVAMIKKKQNKNRDKMSKNKLKHYSRSGVNEQVCRKYLRRKKANQ